MKRMTRILAAIGLMMVLSLPAWADAKKTYFTTTVGSMTTVDPGTVFTDGQLLYIMGAISSYDEVATDPRIAGPAVVHVNAVFALMTITGSMWGTARRERADGAWDCHWVGTRTMFTDADGKPHTQSTIRETGIGRDGYEGLVARWTITAVDADAGNSFAGGGYIIEAKGGPGDRPMQSRSVGTERVDLVVFPSQPSVTLPMAKWEILQEVAQASHLGHSSNQGLGMLDLITGTVTGSGTLTSVNGDLLYWVATGSSLGPTGLVDLTLHWAGGTGRFEAAVGAINGMLELVPAEDPFLMDFTLNAKGSIRY
jgi:hypothetical protein